LLKERAGKAAQPTVDMKLPTAPPKFDLSPERSRQAIQLLVDPKLRDYFRRANERYWHWDELRRRPTVGSHPHELLWQAVKFTRLSARPFGLSASNGEAFRFWQPEPVQRDLHEIDLHLGGNIGVDVPALKRGDRTRYLMNSLMEEAIASSQIEGAATTRVVAKEMLRRARPPRNRDERMIFNNYRTIRRLDEWRERPLGVDMLLEIQASMTADTLDDQSAVGRFRTRDDDVRVVDVRDNAVLHIPPPAADLPRRLEALCGFANAEQADEFVHPVVRAILLHFWLGYEHPFVDGNGRTARALFYWHMLRSGYWLFEFLPISRVIVKAPVQYGRAYLHSETDDYDATYFLVFHLRAICHALRDLRAYLRDRQEQRHDAEAVLKTLRGLNSRQALLAKRFLDEPSFEVTTEMHMHLAAVSYGTAYNDLRRLAERGYLKRSREGHEFVFTATPKLLTSSLGRSRSRDKRGAAADSEPPSA
jgi:Fic family protein